MKNIANDEKHVQIVTQSENDQKDQQICEHSAIVKKDKQWCERSNTKRRIDNKPNDRQ